MGNPAFPFQELVGYELEKGAGRCEARLDIDERHMNPNGVVHGAVLFALLDTAMGGATSSVMEPGSWCATIDVNIRFLSPCTSGRVTAEVTVRKAGRRIVHLDGVVRGEDGKEYASATGTYAVVGGAT